MTARVYTDHEVAKHLQLPLRRIREKVDENGLCMRATPYGPRRLTEGHLEALKRVLTTPCPSKSMNAPKVRATSISGELSKGFGMKEALELASARKPKQSGPRSKPNSTSAQSSGQKRSQPLLRPQPCS